MSPAYPSAAGRPRNHVPKLSCRKCWLPTLLSLQGCRCALHHGCFRLWLLVPASIYTSEPSVTICCSRRAQKSCAQTQPLQMLAFPPPFPPCRAAGLRCMHRCARLWLLMPAPRDTSEPSVPICSGRQAQNSCAQTQLPQMLAPPLPPPLRGCRFALHAQMRQAVAAGVWPQKHNPERL